MNEPQKTTLSKKSIACYVVAVCIPLVFLVWNSLTEERLPFWTRVVSWLGPLALMLLPVFIEWREGTKRRLAVAEQEAAAVENAAETVATPVGTTASAPKHWWTDNGVREETQQNGETRR